MFEGPGKEIQCREKKRDAYGKGDTHNFLYTAMKTEMIILIDSPMKTLFSAPVELKNK